MAQPRRFGSFNSNQFSHGRSEPSVGTNVVGFETDQGRRLHLGGFESMSSVSEQIKDLAALLEEGLITREQFEEQRDQLLAESRVLFSGRASDPTLLTAVGSYQIFGLIGEGGMGAVYRGRHRSATIAERQGGEVAVKVMHPQYARNPDYRDRFEREAALGLKLDHPGIVKVHDLAVDGGDLALVMDFIEGRPLSESIGEAVGPIPWEKVRPLFKRLLEAVGYAHDRGVVHRDIKPENIVVTADGDPRIIDFGIAKDLDGSGTRTGTGMGTVEYMAPEQYTDAKAVDHRADIYSLGMILYEMLAGRLPWDADAPQFEILERKARKQLMSPSAYCPDIPREVVAALSPCVSALPSARPSSTGALLDWLDEASFSRTRIDPPAERRSRTRNGSQSPDAALPSRTPSRPVEAMCPNCGMTFRGRSPGMNCSFCNRVLVEKVPAPRNPVSVPPQVKAKSSSPSPRRAPSKLIPSATTDSICPQCGLSYRGRSAGERCASCNAVLEKKPKNTQRPSRDRPQTSRSLSSRNTDQPKRPAARPWRSPSVGAEAICPNCGLTFRGRSPGMNCSSCNRVLVEKSPAPRNPVPVIPRVEASPSSPAPRKVPSKGTPTRTTESICPQCCLSYRGRSAGDRCASCNAVLEEKPKSALRTSRVQSPSSRDSSPQSIYLSEEPAALARRSLVVDVEAMCPNCGLIFRGRSPGLNCTSCNRVLVEKATAPRNPVPKPRPIKTNSSSPASVTLPSKGTPTKTTEAICPQCGLSYRGRSAGDRCASCKAVLKQKPKPAQRPNLVHEQTTRRSSPRSPNPRPTFPSGKLISPKTEKNFRSTLAYSVISMLLIFGVLAVLVVWAAFALIAAVS